MIWLAGLRWKFWKPDVMLIELVALHVELIVMHIELRSYSNNELFLYLINYVSGPKNRRRLCELTS